jgi:hypothetical protein
MGMIMNTIVTRLITRAMPSPVKRSRTIAIATTRDDAVARPAANRASSNSEKLVATAAIRLNATPRNRLVNSTGRRPNRSERGPWTICAAPRPRTKAEITHCRSLGFATPRLSPMAGRAGSITSMDSAIIAIKAAIMVTNSRNPISIMGEEERGACIAARWAS